MRPEGLFNKAYLHKLNRIDKSNWANLENNNCPETLLVQRFSDSSFTLIPGDVEAAEEIHCSNMLIVTSSMEEEVVYKKRSLNIVPIIKF